MNYIDVGYYLVVANLSDIAAMGAKPLGLTTVVRYSENMTKKDFEDVFHGIRLAADFYNVQVVGGDIGSYHADVFAATAFGLINPKKALLRKNVKKGDLLCLTGPIGLAAAAMLYVKKLLPVGIRISKDDETKLIASWCRPVARINEGTLLSSECLANACQDVSDGLTATISQLSKNSGICFTVEEEKIPISDLTRTIASYLKIEPLTLAMSASVDFQLLFTVAPDKEKQYIEIFELFGFPIYIIGATNNLGENIIIKADGHSTELPGIPWDQQSDDLIEDILGKSNYSA
jgi:thiamine-monophosphate kinase